MKEEVRRVLALMLTLAGWFGSFGLGTYGALTYDASRGHFPPAWFTPALILLIGTAIAAGTALGRMRSVQTLTKVFNAGALSAMNGRNHDEDGDHK